MHLAKAIVGALITLSLSSVLATPVASSASLRTVGPVGSVRERRGKLDNTAKQLRKAASPSNRVELISKLAEGPEALARYELRTGALQSARQQVVTEAEALREFVTLNEPGPFNAETFRIVNELASDPVLMNAYLEQTKRMAKTKGREDVEVMRRGRLGMLAESWADVRAVGFPPGEPVPLHNLVDGAPSSVGPKLHPGWGALAIVGLVEAGLAGAGIYAKVANAKVE